MAEKEIVIMNIILVGKMGQRIRTKRHILSMIIRMRLYMLRKILIISIENMTLSEIDSGQVFDLTIIWYLD